MIKYNILVALLLLTSVLFGANLKDYTISTDVTGGAIDMATLDAEIIADGSVTNYNGFIVRNGVVTVMGDSLSNESALDTVFADHVVPSPDPNANVTTAIRIKSPNGTVFIITVDNSGNVSAAAK